MKCYNYGQTSMKKQQNQNNNTKIDIKSFSFQRNKIVQQVFLNLTTSVKFNAKQMFSAISVRVFKLECEFYINRILIQLFARFSMTKYLKHCLTLYICLT